MRIFVTLAQLAEGGFLAEGALIYVETPRATPIAIPTGWTLEKEKQAGQVCMRLFSR